MRALILALVLAGFGLNCAEAQPLAPAAPAQPSLPAPPPPARTLPSAADLKLAETIVFYYVRSDLASVPSVFAALKDTEAMQRTGLSRATLAGFLATLFQQNRSRVEGWIGKADDYPADGKSAIIFALWQSGNTDLVASLFHEGPDFLRDKPGNLYTLMPSRAVELDLKWGAFFASGNPGFVATLVEALDPLKPLTGNNQFDKAIRLNAAQGLVVNLRQHEVLERYIRRRAGEASGAFKKALEAVLADGMAGFKPAPDHDGDFSGTIAMLELPGKAASGGNAGEATMLTDITPQAHRGDTVGVTLLFSGMGLKEDLSADVSYDIKVTGPDGAVDPRSAQDGVTALKDKVGGRFALVDSRSTLSIHFEPDDKPGPYRIDVLLKDNVAGKKVALTRSIELVDK